MHILNKPGSCVRFLQAGFNWVAKTRKQHAQALAFSSVFLLPFAYAQTPFYLAADIPLDPDAIYQELSPDTRSAGSALTAVENIDYAKTTRSIIDQMRRN